MKPAAFEYDRPADLGEALDLLGRYGDEAKILAGGQSLVPVMNFRLAAPARLVDLNRVGELAGIRRTADGGFSIGAMTRVRALERDRDLGAAQPLLAEAVPWIAHPQIRNRGTVGGSVAHADPAAELPAVLIALGARCRVLGSRGERRLPIGELLTGLFETAIEPHELLAEIEVPPLPRGAGTAFLEVARRHGDYALAGLACLLELDADGRIRRPRLVYLSLGDRPVDAAAAAGLLEGERPDDALFGEVAERALEACEPRDDVHATADFKRHLARTLTRRALRQAADRAEAA